MALDHVWLSEEPPSWTAGIPWLAVPARWLLRLGDRTPHAHAAGHDDGDTRSGAFAARGSAVDGGDFESFVRQFERAILNYLWRMTGDEQTAYDLTQEVFVRAWQHFAAVSHYDQPRAWLFRVATNLALTHNAGRSRRAGSLGELSLLAGEDAPGESDPARRFAESEWVRQVLLQLPPKRRAALVLREVYGLSTAEVGAALGMSETAVRMAISRAREQFRALYLQGEGRA